MKNKKKHPVTILLNNFLMAAITMLILMIIFSGWLNWIPSNPVLLWLSLSVLSAWVATILELKRKR